MTDKVDGELLYHAECIGEDCTSSDGNVRLVYGVGVNNADYAVTRNFVEGKKKTQVWMCPFYNQWKHILERGYSSKFKKRNPSYLNVFVNKKWHRFSNFRKWMITQKWEGMELDKDILFEGNLEYSEDKCCFVPKKVNRILIDRFTDRGKYPLGVYFQISSPKNPYKATISDNSKIEYLGIFSDPMIAHKYWQIAKAQKIENLVNWWKTDLDNLHTFQENVASALLKIANKLKCDAEIGIETKRI